MSKLSTTLATLALLFSAALPSCASKKEEAPAAAPAADSTKVVGTVSGQPITMAEVEEKAGGRLAELEQQRYETIRGTVEQIAFERLVKVQMEERKLSEEDLFKAEIADKIPTPTDAEIQAFWEQNKAQAGDRKLEDVRPQIVNALQNQKRQQRMQEYLESLKAGAEVAIMVDPPRKDVPILEGTPARGPESAPVTLVEFSDFDCPFCKRAHPTIERLLKEYGDRVRFVYSDFPLAMHQRAMPAAQAARCAGEQGKYWEYYENLMTVDGDLSDENLKQRATDAGLDADALMTCYQSGKFQPQVDESVKAGQRLGVDGTPTFFINGRKVVGPSYENLKEVIDEELARAGKGTTVDKG